MDRLSLCEFTGFNDVAEHDVRWGMLHVEYREKFDNPFLQYVLSLGLETIWDIASTEVYEDRRQLLESRGCPALAFTFLYEGLKEINSYQFNGTVLAPRQVIDVDTDSGPEDAWQWAHDDEEDISWVYEENRQSLRRWGYVLWDRSRLEAVGLFKNRWVDPDDSVDPTMEREENQRQSGYMVNSWDRREDIFFSGGKGWWSRGDESQATWRERKEPSGHTTGTSGSERDKPKSLQEAREMLAMMKLPDLPHS